MNFQIISHIYIELKLYINYIKYSYINIYILYFNQYVNSMNRLKFSGLIIRICKLKENHIVYKCYL